MYRSSLDSYPINMFHPMHVNKNHFSMILSGLSLPPHQFCGATTLPPPRCPLYNRCMFFDYHDTWFLVKKIYVDLRYLSEFEVVDIASLNKSLTQYTFTMRPRWKEHKVTRTRQNPYVVPPNKDIDSYVLLNDMYTLKSTSTQLRRLVQLVWGHDKNKRTLL